MPACQDAFKTCRESAGQPSIRGGEGAAMYMFNRTTVYLNRTAEDMGMGMADTVTNGPPFRIAYGPKVGVPYSLYPTIPLQPGEARRLWEFPVYYLAFTFLHEMAHLSGALKWDIHVSQIEKNRDEVRQANVVAAKCLGQI